VLGLRARQQRNFLATLLLSQGVPMISHGDEMGRTQRGNNNGYAQDSELTWMHWDDADQPLVAFTAAISRLRRDHPVFRRSRFFHGRPVRRGEGEPVPDIVWFGPEGEPMQPEDWDEQLNRSVGVFLNGLGIRERDARGRPVTDVNFLVYFNAAPEDVEVVLPPDEYSPQWEIVVDTAGEEVDTVARPAGARQTIAARSLVVMRAWSEPEVVEDHSVAASLAANATGPLPLVER